MSIEKRVVDLFKSVINSPKIVEEEGSFEEGYLQALINILMPSTIKLPEDSVPKFDKVAVNHEIIQNLKKLSPHLTKYLERDLWK